MPNDVRLSDTSGPRVFISRAVLAVFGSFIMRPHPNDFNGVFGLMNLIHQPMLDVDAARVSPSQIANELLERWRVLEGVFGDNLKKALRLGFEV